MEGGSENDETRSQKIVANFFYFDFMRVLIAKRSREGQNFICQFFFYLLLFIFSATTQIRSSLSISVSLAHRLTYSHINAYVHMRVKNKKKKINKTKKNTRQEGRKHVGVIHANAKFFVHGQMVTTSLGAPLPSLPSYVCTTKFL